MSAHNFTASIPGRKTEYTMRTTNFDSMHRIIINLNDHDQVIHTLEIPYEDGLSDEHLLALVKRYHEERAESLTELLKISKKLEGKPDVDSNHKLGLVFLNHGMAVEAVEEFKRALSLDPENAPILNHFGLALVLNEQAMEAVEIFQHALAIKPDYPDIRNNLGMAYLKSEQFDAAREAFEQALAINARYGEANFNLCLCLVARAASQGGSTDEERQAMDKHLAKAVEADSRFNNEYYKVALNYLKRSQYPEAMKALNETKNLNKATGEPSEIYHEFYLRLKYGEEGVDRKATEHYIAKLEEILDKHPNFVDVHNDLGVAYLIQCRFLFNRAIKEFKSALEINPGFTAAKKNLKLAENEGKGFLILLRAILYF